MEHNNEISDILMIIGRNVKKYRLFKELTQQELAFLCGKTDRCTISNIERFNCDGLNLNTLIKIAHVLEINLSDLFKE